MGQTKADIRATYNRIAESFAARRREPWPEVLSFIEALRRGSRVLDLGAGNGRHAKILARRGIRPVAVDFSRRLLMIGQTGEGGEGDAMRIDWVGGEATKLPFRNGSFDAALCIAVLHHLPLEADRLESLRELRRVLRAGAPVLVSVWAREQPRFQSALAPPEVDGDVEVPWTMPDRTVVRRFYHVFKAGELERLIIASGLDGERFFRGAGNWFAQARSNG
ncbi:MAG TPA: class I SAM-dependent methyltransferase [Thermoplasmata archaeon]|nr:class I SAM-dependent methyltransferase [Thermoplasmata archaeon]